MNLGYALFHAINEKKITFKFPKLSKRYQSESLNIDVKSSSALFQQDICESIDVDFSRELVSCLFTEFSFFGLVSERGLFELTS